MTTVPPLRVVVVVVVLVVVLDERRWSLLPRRGTNITNY